MHFHINELSTEFHMQETSEAEHAYWLSREKAAVSAPIEIDVTVFHDAAGLMYPMNWCHDAARDTETFMLQEMYCGNVTEIYARCDRRYFRMRDYSHTSHNEIIAKVMQLIDSETATQK